MKKFSLIMCLLVMMFSVIPVVRAEEVLKQKSNKYYGDIYVDETPPDSANKKVILKVSITKTFNSGYVYMNFVPTKNVSNIKVISVGSSFDKVSEKTNSNGRVSVLFKTKSGAAINGTKTELVTITADADDKALTEGCQLDFNPLNLDCSVSLESEGLYFDNSGNKISKADYDTKCNGGNGGGTPNPKDPDVPNPKTGEVIPYAVIGGGLVAVLVVYLFSRKSNKMYKL